MSLNIEVGKKYKCRNEEIAVVSYCFPGTISYWRGRIVANREKVYGWGETGECRTNDINRTEGRTNYAIREYDLIEECQEQYKPDLNLKIEIGKKYVCKNGSIVSIKQARETFVGHSEYNDVLLSTWDKKGRCITFDEIAHDESLNLLEEFIEDEYVKPEDLVPGGKYEINDSPFNPYIFVCNVSKDYGFIHGRPLKFIDKRGDFTSLPSDMGIKIKKHIPKPAIKTRVTEWFVVYNPSAKPYLVFGEDAITNLYTNATFYHSYKDAKDKVGNIYTKIAKVKTTAEIEENYHE